MPSKRPSNGVITTGDTGGEGGDGRCGSTACLRDLTCLISGGLVTESSVEVECCSEV